jgi:outer membrane biogenesis lipoprotein LolB
MKRSRTFFTTLIIAAFILVACGLQATQPPATEAATEVMTEAPTEAPACGSREGDCHEV